MDGPEVLADLDAERATGGFIRKQQVGGERRRIVPEINLGGCEPGRGGEPALLVVFTRGGQELLGDKTQHSPCAEDRRAVVEPAMHHQREADDGVDFQPCGRGGQLEQRLACPGEQERLCEQVAAGVAGEAQLRKERDHGAGFRGGLHGSTDSFDIEGNISHAQLGRTRGDADEVTERNWPGGGHHFLMPRRIKLGSIQCSAAS